MLIEFSVSNFRSFRERQTLSMVAAPRLHKRENVFKPELDGEKFPDLLKVAVVYGPNASGKSNLLKAMEAVALMAIRSPNDGAIPLPVAPFGFDPLLADQPSVFVVHFIYQRVRYQFELSATAERIVKERLVSFPKGKETLLYDREHTAGGDKYLFGDKLEGGRDIFEVWRKVTPSRVLFLAQAVANSSEELLQLGVPLGWLETGMFLLLDGMSRMVRVAQHRMQKNHQFASDMTSFLSSVDIPISQIKIDETKSVPITLLTHQSALGASEFVFSDESEGTKNLFGFLIPWLLKDAENAISVLVIDELDSSLHPMIVAALVAKHINNPIPTQLIFTTHDTHLMDAKLLRRDQIWITERDVNGATQLRSVHDFEGREGEDIEKRYFEGRYRGLPFVKKA